MKNVSPELIELLNTADKLKFADLYTFTLTNDTNIYYTSADFDIKYNENTYLCNNAGIKRSSMSWLTGLSVDNLEVEFYPSDTDLIGDITLIEAFRNGTFDGALMRLDMAFYDDWTGIPLILDKLFIGNADIDAISGNYAKLEIKSLTEKLNIKFPADIYQSSCSFALYSTGCGVNKTSFSSNGSVLADSTKKIINCHLLQTNDYFTQGVITFNSGQNLNVKRSIKSHSSGQLTLSHPLQYNPTIGDSFTVSAGCNKTMDICKNKFNNLNNFSGCPFIPNPDQSL